MLLLASEIMLVPFVGWGIHLLRRRLGRHDDIAPLTMGVTLAGVIVFFLLEMATLEVVLRDSLLIYIFATLGLLVACAALYGHVLVSFLSWFLVDFFLPAEVREGNKPRLGPAEALEHHGDYEGALEGYRVLARIYPGNAEIAMRVAENLGRLERANEVGPWVRRAILGASGVNEEFALVSRACVFYERQLASPEEARALLRDFLTRHPNGDDAARALDRLAGVGTAPAAMQSDSLAALASNPLEAQEMVEEHSRGHKKVRLGMARLDGAPVGEEAEPATEDSTISGQAPVGGVVPLGLGESLTSAEEEEDRRPRRVNQLRIEDMNNGSSD